MKKTTKKVVNRNEVAIAGKIDSIYYSSDKASCFTLEVQNEKGRCWLKVKVFDDIEVEEGDSFECLGYLTTESSEYKGKKRYETVLVATEIVEN